MGVIPGTNPLKKMALNGGCRLATCLLVLMGVGVPVTALANLVINEFLPDPAGSDGGREFVELINTGDTPVSLELVALQFANGAVGADWLTRWRGEGWGSLAPGARFLLVDRNWLGPVPGDDEVYLGLQNGPDAIRLVRESSVVDLVGYGPLTDSELFEGQPVPVSPGRSLARRPDGHDTQDNRADFAAADPSPGAPNFLPYSLLVAEETLDPAQVPRPGDLLRVTLVLRNNGTEALPAGPCRLVWPSGVTNGWWDGAVPDAERTLIFLVRPELRGVLPLIFEYPVPDRAEILALEVGPVQVGAAALRLHEVMPAPDQGQGEWVELQWAGPGSLDLTGYKLRDEDGGWVALPAVSLSPGALAVVAEDSASLVNWWAVNRNAGGGDCGGELTGPMVLRLSSWPLLNNTPPDSRLHADAVFLADPAGVILDAVSWGGQRYELPDRGLSLERIGLEPVNPGAANWTVCTALEGSTPGCPNSVGPGAASGGTGGTLTAAPVVLDRAAGQAAMHLSFALVGFETTWEVRVFNLWGDGVRDFGGDARGAGPRDLVWDGRDDRGQPVGPGAYIAWLETRSATGLALRREKIRVVVR